MVRMKLVVVAGLTIGSAFHVTGAVAQSAAQSDDCTCRVQQEQRYYPSVTVTTKRRVATIEWESYVERRLVPVVRTKEETYYEPVPYRVSRIDCGCEGPGHVEYRNELRSRTVTYTEMVWKEFPSRRQVIKTHDEPVVFVVPAEDVAKYVKYVNAE